MGLDEVKEMLRGMRDDVTRTEAYRGRSKIRLHPRTRLALG